MGLINFVLERTIDILRAADKLFPDDPEYERQRRNNDVSYFSPEKYDASYVQCKVQDVKNYRMGRIGFYSEKLIYHIDDEPTAAVIYMDDITKVKFVGRITTIETDEKEYSFECREGGLTSLEGFFKKYYYFSHCWCCNATIIASQIYDSKYKCNKCGRFVCKKCKVCHCGFKKW